MPLFRLLLLIGIVHPLASQEPASPDRGEAVVRGETSEGATLRSRPLIRAATTSAATVADRADLKRARVNIKGLQGRLQDWQLTDLEGRDVKSQLDPVVQGDQLTLGPDALRQFVIKPKAVSSRAVELSEVMVLPGGIVVAGGEDAASESESMGWFRLTFLASPLPAVWDPLSELYATTITFGLKPPAGVPSSKTLDKPVVVRVSFDGLAGEEPPELRIGGPGLENEQSFPLRFRPTTAEPTLKVRSTLSDVDLKLQAVRRLTLRALQSEILGFGLEQATFTVSELLPHGAEAMLESRAPIAVSVKGRAQVEPNEIAFEPGLALSQFRVRSAGLGALPVRAQSGGLSAEATVQQRFPVGPLVAVLLGGALGGYARRFVKGSRRAQAARRIVEGLVVAVIAFVAGVLDVGYLNLPSAIVATEAGAFLTGALSGFLGVIVLEKITGGLSRKPA